MTGEIIRLLLGVVTTLVCCGAFESENINEDLMNRLEFLEKRFASELKNMHGEKIEIKRLFEESKSHCDREISSLRRTLAEQTSFLSSPNLLQNKEVQISGAKHHEHDTKTRRQVQPDIIAFTAYVDHNVDHMGLEQIIPYNRVVTNEGGAFNVNTHVFTSPVSGLYFFSFFVSEVGDRELVAKLVVDGQNVIDAIANPIRFDHDQQGGNMAVVRLRKGQSAWVVNYNQNDVFLRTDETFRITSFSGMLMRADDV